jgi:glycerophosphoryl diester phosphodiesterase
MKPLILAHRGACADAPENTLAAFARAFELGADGVELDVTLTRDGVPVVIHDDTVDRTTNSKGAVAALTLAEIQQLDAGAWFGEKFRGERIPTLAQVFDLVPAGKIVNVEIKGTSVRDDGLPLAIIRVIEDKNFAERVILSSFNPFALYRAAFLAPRLPRGLLYAATLPIYLRRAWLRPIARVTAMHPDHTLVTRRFVRWTRAKKYKINTWTVDDPGEARRLADLGVDAIITNKPDVIRKEVDK